MFTCPFSPQLVMKTLAENHDKKPKDQVNFHMWTLISYMDGGISVLVGLFFNWSMSIYSKSKLFIFSSLCILVPIYYNF